jgi:hypothetical protein
MLAAFSYAMDKHLIPNWIAPFLLSIDDFVKTWTATTLRQHPLYQAVANRYATQAKDPIGKVAAAAACEFLRVEISAARIHKSVNKLAKNAIKDRAALRKVNKKVDALASEVGDIQNVLNTMRGEGSKSSEQPRRRRPHRVMSSDSESKSKSPNLSLTTIAATTATVGVFRGTNVFKTPSANFSSLAYDCLQGRF